MGRKKIRMGFIENDRLRVITNAKRKKGLIKKAMELSLLCGSEILLIIHEKSLSRTVMYSSLQETSEELFTDVFVNKTATLSYSSEDYFSMFAKDMSDEESVVSVKRPKPKRKSKPVQSKKQAKKVESVEPAVKKTAKRKRVELSIEVCDDTILLAPLPSTLTDNKCITPEFDHPLLFAENEVRTSICAILILVMKAIEEKDYPKELLDNLNPPSSMQNERYGDMYTGLLTGKYTETLMYGVFPSTPTPQDRLLLYSPLESRAFLF